MIHLLGALTPTSCPLSLPWHVQFPRSGKPFPAPLPAFLRFPRQTQQPTNRPAQSREGSGEPKGVLECSTKDQGRRSLLSAPLGRQVKIRERAGPGRRARAGQGQERSPGSADAESWRAGARNPRPATAGLQGGAGGGGAGAAATLRAGARGVRPAPPRPTPQQKSGQRQAFCLLPVVGYGEPVRLHLSHLETPRGTALRVWVPKPSVLAGRGWRLNFWIKCPKSCPFLDLLSPSHPTPTQVTFYYILFSTLYLRRISWDWSSRSLSLKPPVASQPGRITTFSGCFHCFALPISFHV